MPVVPTVTPNGERIREVRMKLGLSPAEVAARMVRRHWKTIDRIERGDQTRASVDYINELAAALGQPADEFIKAAA